MQPSDRQLLKQLRKATGQLLKETDKPEHQALLGVMDVVLNELLLRNDNGFFIDYYQRGYRLLEEGLTLPGPKVVAIGADFNALPGRLDSRFSMDAIGAQALKLSAALEKLVNAIGSTTAVQPASLLKRITDWEVSLFAHRLKKVAVNHDEIAGQSVTINRENLQDYLRHKKPEWKNLEVTHFHRVAGGFAKCTILFDTVDAVNGKQSLCIRAHQPIHLLELDGADIANEFPVVRKAYESGIAVAEPLWLEADGSLLNTRFIVSRKAGGTNFGTVTGGKGRLSPTAVKDLARVLASIHNIPLNRGEAWIKESHFAKWLDFGSTRANTLARVNDWWEQGQRANIFPSPGIARARNWLIDNVPDYDEAPTFLHGDFGPHNILLDGDRVSAALDWEVSLPGDPAYDVSWFLNSTGGAVDQQSFLDAYHDAGGKPLSEYRLRYFDVFACLILPTTCNAALKLLQDNDAAGISLAIIGLQFMHEFSSRLDAAIASAEAVRHLQ